jgi:hypothetical protein
MTATRISPTQWRYAFAIGGAFTAWVLQFAINYTLVDYGCGTVNKTIIRLVSLTALGISGAAALIAWSLPTNGPASGAESAPEDLVRFGAIFARLMNGIFLVLVLATGIATLVLSPCEP